MMVDTRLLTVLLVLLSAVRGDADSCPLWFVPRNGSQSGCVCNKHLKGVINCDQESENISIHLGDCMTYDTSSSSVIIGQCPYMHHPNIVDHVYVKLPRNVSDLNGAMCGPLNREGKLCAHCKQGFGPAIYSIGGLQCESCKNNHYGWGVYFLLEIVPNTLFFLTVVVFQIRLTAAPMASFVFFCQLAAITFSISTLSTALVHDSGMQFEIVVSAYGILNLDFFRIVIPPFCISESLTNIHILLFDYIAAVYSLLLVVLTYICIELHDSDFKPLVWLWRPFYKCLGRFKRTWNIKESIIHTFATFLLLSYSKIIYVSSQLLHGTYLYNSKGEIVGPVVFYFDPTMIFFSKEHLPFAIISVFVIVVFVVLPPLLLILYPTRIFRRCFERCGLRRRLALRIFVETFQWCYKDGTEGTRDFRSLSGLYLVLRILIQMTYIISTISIGNGSNTWIYGAVLFTILSLLFSLARPYKSNKMNTMDSILMALLAIMSTLCVPYLNSLNPGTTKVLSVIIFLLSSTPLFVLILYIMYNALTKVLGYLKTKLYNTSATQTAMLEIDRVPEFSPETLPDRLFNANEYTPLLTST